MRKFAPYALGMVMAQAALAQRALLSWDEAHRQAAAMLTRMTPEEKHSLMQGVGWDQWQQRKWWYVGNTRAIPRLGIPSLNFQDASGGFRTSWHCLIGTVTSWPSLLSLAATWSPASVEAAAVAIGKEFRSKGANAILGPSVNVHRVARGGRNFEYLSGEDPYLGSRLAAAYVKGVQSEGVISVMKHWVFNQQEEHRGTEDSIVDEKTARELYYPPFEASIDAGVAAAMCAYNKVNGEHACSSKRLFELLKGELGFRGFVQSDWWATHSLSLEHGLDQEMPGEHQTIEHFSPAALGAQLPGVVDAAVARVLASMYRVGLVGSDAPLCTPPDCRPMLERNATSAAHAALSRSLAAESVVLLKNDGGVLPLSAASARTIAVIGDASVAQPYDPDGLGQGQGGDWRKGDYYSGGGSGHLVAGRVITPLDGIKARAASAGVRVLESPSNDVEAARRVARQVDVAIVVAATTSGEAVDRKDLHLDGGADALISAVAAEARRTVVLTQVPGAVLMPWRDEVPAILAMFLGGQETGAAWASVLFGDEAPSGRLPLMMPATEADTIAPSAATLADIAPRVVYSEGMATSYRSPSFRAAYPFGHGLAYTTFAYGAPRAAPCRAPGRGALCVRLSVRNAGAAAGRAVPQLYLEFPPEAGHPSALLKGFEKTDVLAPGGRAEVEFRLSDRDFSYYSAAEGAWVKTATAVALIGESSADIRRRLPLKAELLSAQALGSCQIYGCAGYSPGNLCQCNAACARHRNCCHDYQEETCARQSQVLFP